MVRRIATISPDRKRSIFLDRLSDVLGKPVDTVRDIASNTSGTSFWLNPLCGSVDDARAELETLEIDSQPIAGLANAFQLNSEKSLLAESVAFTEGRVFIQNMSSMIAVDALSPVAGELILDVCASPGGKSARAAALTNNAIKLWANDSIKPRVDKMKSVFEQFGVKPTQITSHPGQYINKFITESFDRILLDAQCSGEARVDLRRSDSLRYWSEERIQEMSYLQQKMLVASWKLLKPGGVLVYSTCTFSPEENESPIDFLLKHHRDVEVTEVEVPLANAMPGLSKFRDRTFNPALKNAVRILPGPFNEAFFVCKLRKLS